MFIIEKPYVSEYLMDTVINHDWPVLDNETIEYCGLEEDVLNLWSSESAKEYYLKQEFPLIYSNSEMAISWVLENLPQSNLTQYIKTFKNKFLFREMLKEDYPDFYYRTLEYLDINYVNKEEYAYPLVIKPTQGFLNFGVRYVKDSSEWEANVKSLHKEYAINKTTYDENVVDAKNIIIEEYVSGESFLIDAFYDRNGIPVILNIFKLLYKEGNPINEKMYITSAALMVQYMSKFTLFLRDLGEKLKIKNFPLNIELKLNEAGDIIPIEVNPMCFSNWGISDLAQYAWKFNIYEYFESQRHPDWNNLLQDAGQQIYYVSLIDIPKNFPKSTIREYNYDGYLAGFSNIFELRRINFKSNPLFGIVLGSTSDEAELNMILNIDTGKYII